MEAAAPFQQEVGPLTSQATPCSTACATALHTVSSAQAGMAKVSSYLSLGRVATWLLEK